MKNLIPQDLRSLSRNLIELGFPELAWTSEYALQVVNYLTENNCIILGGDVYRVDENITSIQITGDSWYYNQNKSISDCDNISESRSTAFSYINNYHNKNGSQFMYSIIFEQLSK